MIQWSQTYADQLQLVFNCIVLHLSVCECPGSTRLPIVYVLEYTSLNNITHEVVEL